LGLEGKREGSRSKFRPVFAQISEAWLFPDKVLVRIAPREVEAATAYLLYVVQVKIKKLVVAVLSVLIVFAPAGKGTRSSSWHKASAGARRTVGA
jgi:hypothetical protein